MENDRNWAINLLIVSGTTMGAVVLALILLGITQCVRRDWSFEDKCRKAGGVVMIIRQFNGDTSKEGCVKNVVPSAATVEIIPIER